MTEISNTQIVGEFVSGFGALERLPDFIKDGEISHDGQILAFIDDYFRDKEDLLAAVHEVSDKVYFVSASKEPTTDGVDALKRQIVEDLEGDAVQWLIGVGGGCVLDTAKAVANLLTNPGQAADYQGWDLVKGAGVPKIGIPTISGTGAEASRTCVMLNAEKNLKLGMNSRYTLYDKLILDPALSKTVPREQYFYTAMDTYIHCIESLDGRFRNLTADALSVQALALCEDVFAGEDMMSDELREKLMLASYLGGSAIGNSFVGVVHPLSAALSVVLGTHHCEANCIVMNAMEAFYPSQTEIFIKAKERQGVELKTGVAKGLSEEDLHRLYDASIIHNKPLENALGPDFKSVLTRDRVIELFLNM